MNAFAQRFTLIVHPLDVLENVLATRGVSGVRRPLHVEASRSSISNLLEFTAIRWSWWSAHGVDLAAALPSDGETWTGVLPTPGTTMIIPFARHDAEVHAVPPTLNSGWEPGDPFMTFQERFKTKLVDAGVSSAFAHALLGAMNEMASNATEHAAAPCAPVAGYEVGGQHWSFCVTDVGCGVLETLRRNYANLGDDVAAVQLALQDGVSSTGQKARGYGFTHLFKALVNRLCTIRFRSTGAVANWSGSSPAAHHLNLMVSPPRAGFHVHIGGPIKST